MKARFFRSLTDRRMRVFIQLLASATVALAALLATFHNTGADIGGVLLVGGIGLFSLKIGLMSLNRRVLAEPTETFVAELEDLRQTCDAQRAEIESLAQTVPALTGALEHQTGLVHRTEPALAEFAILRHEVAYLREALERLRSEVDV
jgi:hypothetical protein